MSTTRASRKFERLLLGRNCNVDQEPGIVLGHIAYNFDKQTETFTKQKIMKNSEILKSGDIVKLGSTRMTVANNSLEGDIIVKTVWFDIEQKLCRASFPKQDLTFVKH